MRSLARWCDEMKNGLTKGGVLNTNDMHKKKIEQVWWPDSETKHGCCISSGDEIHLEMSATYHGDHDEFWIVEYKVENGELKEIARHNPRYVETILWA